MLSKSHRVRIASSVCVLMAVALFARPAPAQPSQRTLFCTNNVSGNVSVYTVNANGTLTPVAGSPYAAGTNPQALAITADGGLLAVVNATMATIEELRVFTVGATGALTEAAGSPYLVNDGPLGMAIGGPAGNEFCFVPSASSDRIHVFDITGSTLTQVPGSPFVTADFPVEAAVTADGSKLYVSHLLGQVSGYTISAGGALTPVPGSPYTTNGDAFELIVVEDHLYIGTGLSNVIDAYEIQPDGSLVLVPGAPFASGGNSAVNLAATPAGDFVFVVHVVSDSVTAMSRSAGGALMLVPGSSVVIGNDARKCVAGDDYLFVTDESSLDPGVGIMSYTINPGGTLSLVAGSPFAAGSRPQDLVLFTPAVPVCGDFDGDGDVDLADFATFSQCFGGSNNPPNPGCPPGADADCDDDGDVDLADFSIFAQNYTGSM
jgi:6-phosphogluconolactonase (cycloisomerase 2 family)